MGPAATPQENGAPLEWDDPEGWTPVAGTQFRTANYEVGEETECYLVLLPGDAGGMLANINRWRGQMGLAPTTLEEIEAGPKVKLLGQPSALVALEGDFTGMGGGTHTGWKMLGGLLGTPAGTLFVKMVGPAAEVDSERGRFLSFCASLRIPGQNGESSTAPVSGAGATVGEGSASNLSWDKPEGWIEESARSMRLVSFEVGAAGEAECYVSVLGGGAGGVEANVNRWRQQVGLAALTPKEVDELPQLDVLGGQATLFEASGSFTGMNGQTAKGEQSILGIIRTFASDVLFVKMVGPSELVTSERDNFIAFCASLSEG